MNNPVLSGIPKFMGSRVRRREDPALITGLGKYTADFCPENTLHLAFVRSPYAHAKILSIDSEDAQTLPGVVAIFAADDINPNLAGTTPIGMAGTEAPFFDAKIRRGLFSAVARCVLWVSRWPWW